MTGFPRDQQHHKKPQLSPHARGPCDLEWLFRRLLQEKYPCTPQPGRKGTHIPDRYTLLPDLSSSQ